MNSATLDATHNTGLSESMPAPAVPNKVTDTECRVPVPYRVLIVDDNADFLESTAVLLASLGNEVMLAGNGVEALAVCERAAPQVVLMDLSMPGLDGYKVARFMRRVPHMQNALLIAIRGRDGPDDVMRSSDAGFQHHLAKPLNWPLFKSLIDASAKRKLES